MFKVVKNKEEFSKIYDEAGESTEQLTAIQYSAFSNGNNIGSIRTHQHGIDINLFNLGKPVANLEVVVNAIISALNE